MEMRTENKLTRPKDRQTVNPTDTHIRTHIHIYIHIHAQTLERNTDIFYQAHKQHPKDDWVT